MKRPAGTLSMSMPGRIIGGAKMAILDCKMDDFGRLVGFDHVASTVVDDDTTVGDFTDDLSRANMPILVDIADDEGPLAHVVVTAWIPSLDNTYLRAVASEHLARPAILWALANVFSGDVL